MKKYFLISFMLLFVACTKDELSKTNPFILLQTGDQFTNNGAYVPIGGKIKFGISAIGDGAAITNLTIKRITNNEEVIEEDLGMYVKEEELDKIFTFNKGSSEKEIWVFSIMNLHRDTASVRTVVYKGDGSAYGPINYYPSITIAYQSSKSFPRYLDLNTGKAYNKQTIAGKEGTIDLVGYYYLCSGKSSPTLSCPGYKTARIYHPEISNWAVQNTVLYDYKTADENLITAEDFDKSQNDSLMISSFIPDKTSSTCKFSSTGKIIPFKTDKNKYGLIKVIRADESETGSIELAIKIQK